MRTLVPAAALVTFLAVPIPALADDARPAVPVVSIDAAPAPPAETPDAAPAVSSTTTVTTTTTTEPAAAKTVAEQLADLQHAFAAYKSASDATAKRLLLFGLIAIAINVLMTLLKSVAGWTASSSAKKWIPVIALGLGVVAGALASLAAGQTLVWSLLYGPAASAAAVFLHELLNLVRKPSTAPPASS